MPEWRAPRHPGNQISPWTVTIHKALFQTMLSSSERVMAHSLREGGFQYL